MGTYEYLVIIVIILYMKTAFAHFTLIGDIRCCPVKKFVQCLDRPFLHQICGLHNCIMLLTPKVIQLCVPSGYIYIQFY